MRSLVLVFVAVMGLGLAGCATRASGVAPVSVSAVEFQGLTCEETRSRLASARERENALTRQQNNAATADAVSVFLFLVPLGSVFGADKEGELAEAKGEVNALERAVDINCKAEMEQMNSGG